MEDYGMALLIAMPIFVLLIIIEFSILHYKKYHINIIDGVSSLYSGMTNILKDTLQLTIVIISYPKLLAFISQYVHLIDWSSYKVASYIVCFILLDFSGYWYHRVCHRVNYFWNLHIVHHSSEEYNLPCALRQQFATITNLLSLFIHGILLATVGIPFEVYALIAPIHLFAQFWYHTKLINRMGFLEYIIVTPSHHRVHHAMNDIYMDKNYSQIFIIWDKLFGTFQEELASEPPVYGVRRPVRTWNPYLINIQHSIQIIKDMWHTNNWIDKIKVWFMPTGWRPQDVIEKYPIYYIKNMSELEKYNPIYSNRYKVWAVVQQLSLFFFLCYLFFSFGKLEFRFLLFYGLFLLVDIFAITSLLDKKFYGVVAEIVRTILGISIIVYFDGWFNIDNYIPYGSLLIGSYFVFTCIVNLYFYYNKNTPEYSVSGV